MENIEDQQSNTGAKTMALVEGPGSKGLFMAGLDSMGSTFHGKRLGFIGQLRGVVFGDVIRVTSEQKEYRIEDILLPVDLKYRMCADGREAVRMVGYNPEERILDYLPLTQKEGHEFVRSFGADAGVARALTQAMYVVDIETFPQRFDEVLRSLGYIFTVHTDRSKQNPNRPLHEFAETGLVSSGCAAALRYYRLENNTPDKNDPFTHLMEYYKTQVLHNLTLRLGNSSADDRSEQNDLGFKQVVVDGEHNEKALLLAEDGYSLARIPGVMEFFTFNAESFVFAVQVLKRWNDMNPEYPCDEENFLRYFAMYNLFIINNLCFLNNDLVALHLHKGESQNTMQLDFAGVDIESVTAIVNDMTRKIAQENDIKFNPITGREVEDFKF